MSEKIEDYLRQAEFAEREARAATDPSEQAALRRIAAGWRDLAETRKGLDARAAKDRK